MKLARILYFLITAFLIACSAENDYKGTHQNPKQETIGEQDSAKRGAKKPDDLYAFLNKYPEKSVPLTDSTNFGNRQPSTTLPEREQELLHLKEVGLAGGTNQRINYRLDLSPNFKTVVISYDWGEELHTCLVNYGQDWKIKGWLEIAYDEVAEGWSRIESQIGRKRIVVKRTSWVNEPPEIGFSYYKITADGEIIGLTR